MNVLFCHLPRTGGTGITRWLERELPGQVLALRPLRDERVDVVRKWLRNEGKPPVLPKDLRVIAGHEACGDLAELAGWTDWWTITTIRNPAERLFSEFSHPNDRTYFPSTFEKYVDHPRCPCLRCQVGPRNKSHRLNPMRRFLEDHAGGEVWRSVDRLVGELALRLGIKVGTYERMHVSGFGFKVTDEQQELVARTHEADWALWRGLNR